MSSTNRGSKRIEKDFYATPENVVENFINHYNRYNIINSLILEPSAGNGNICKILKEKYKSSYVVANEIRTEENENLIKCSDEVFHEDYLTTDKFKNYRFDLIIGNPPFTYAMEFIEKSLKISNHKTDVVMLLRLSFFESQKRFDFMQNHPITQLYILRDRPKFINKSTDSCAYAWFVWNKSDVDEWNNKHMKPQQEIFII